MSQIALVTGASSGIGRAIALRLSREGYTVAIHYASGKERAHTVLEEILSAGGAGFTVGSDLARLEGPERLAEAVLGEANKLGQNQISVLVNNAGTTEYADLASTTPETFQRLFDINVRAPFFLTQRLLPQVAEGGRIINISSIVARHAFPEVMAYAMTKGALDSFTRTLAVEAGKRGISVNSIAPGPTLTELSDWLRDPEGAKAATDRQALKRVAEPEDIAGAVLALTRPEAAWLTGQLLDASGGWGL